MRRIEGGGGRKKGGERGGGTMRKGEVEEGFEMRREREERNRGSPAGSSGRGDVTAPFPVQLGRQS